MNNILTALEAKAFKDIGIKIDEPKVNACIEQAQLTELMPLLGSKFYFDLLSNLENPDYQNLLSGGTFSVNSVNYYQDGIKALLADYFMAKYIIAIQTNVTPFGATQKLSDNSEPADRNSIKDISTQQMQLAGGRWEIIKMYLEANTQLFPNWKTNNSCGEISSGRTFRFRKI